MKRFIFVFILFLSISFIGCGSFKSAFFNSPEVLLKNDFDGNGIAVLTFAKQGSLSSEAGKAAADNLSDALFLINKYAVIDRAKVNAAQADLDIKSPEALSNDQIQQLGLKLKASYLILGRVQEYSENEYLGDNGKKELTISFRIISVLNGEVIGVATYTTNYSGILSTHIKEMVYNIAKKIGIKRAA